MLCLYKWFELYSRWVPLRQVVHPIGTHVIRIEKYPDFTYSKGWTVWIRSFL